ncbi:MAG: hypothetical protein CL608_16160 [Anaerolineaceae bacterium]|nr:hypothetical protein [Anaerolineaceae bacterium]
MDDNKSDIDLPEEATGKQGEQIDRDHEVGENSLPHEVAEKEQQEDLPSANTADYVGGDLVLQDKVEKDHIVADRYIEHQHEINETEYAEADGSDTPPLIFHEESESDAPIIDYSDVLSQLLVNDETGMAHTPDGVEFPAAYVHGDVVFGDKILGNKIISAVYIEQQTIISRTLVDNIEGRPPDPGEPPYKGLQSFTENDADLFFGREQLTAELIQRLVETNFLAVNGKSGSGKSSVVRAGVVPALTGQKHSNIVPETLAAEWTPYIFSPSQQPLQSLTAALFPHQDQQSELFSSHLLEDDTTLLNRLQTLSSSAPILLVIDQFEELFTLDESQDMSSTEVITAFIDNLVTAVTADKKCNFKIIINLRSDFYTDCLEFEALHDLLERHQKIISHMNPDEMREAIIQPASKGQWKIQDGLVEIFLEDVGEEPGRLPLLSHALLETWKRRRMRVMTLTGYQEAGGVKRAIAQTADTTYNNFSSSQQNRVKQIFKRLTAISETHDMYTRRPVSWEELRQDEETQTVIHELSHARLVTVGDYTLEVAHEAVIREWKTLQSWLDEDREGLIIHRRLTIASQTWQEEGNDKGALLRGLRLQETDVWAKSPEAELNDLEWKFLEKSLVNRRREKFFRLGGVGIIFAVILAALIIIWRALIVANDSNQQLEVESNARATAVVEAESEANARATAVVVAETNEQRADARALAVQAEAAIERGDIWLAYWQSIAAVNTTYQIDGSVTGEADVVLHKALTTWPSGAVLEGHTGIVWSASFNHDGSRIVTASADNTARLWDKDGSLINTLEGHTAGVRSASFNDDGSRIVTASDDDTARLWDKDGNLITTLEGHTDTVRSASFNHDGSRIVTASHDGTARLWDGDGNFITTLEGHTEWVTSASFNHDSSRIVTASYDGTARLWDGDGSFIATLEGHTLWVLSANFNHDGSRIVTASADGTVRLWDGEGAFITALENWVSSVSFNHWVTSVSFNHDGSRIVTASNDGTARLWDAEGAFITTLAGHAGEVWSASFNNDGSRIVTASADGTALLWKMNGGFITALEGYSAWVTWASFNHDGSRIVTASNDVTAQLWDGNGTIITILEGHTDRVSSAKFNHDGSRIVTASLDGSTRLWDGNGIFITVLEGHTDRVRSASFNHDGSRIVTASDDSTARLWDGNGNFIAVLEGHTAGVSSANFSHDGSLIVTTSADDTVRLWDGDGNFITTWSAGHRTGVFTASFNHDGSRIVTAGVDYTARLWDTEGNFINDLVGHTGWVRSANFNHNGSRIVTAGDDGTARLWDGEGNFITILIGPTSFGQVADFNHDGSRIITTHSDGIARVWETYSGVDQMLAEATRRLLLLVPEDECLDYFDVDTCKAD